MCGLLSAGEYRAIADAMLIGGFKESGFGRRDKSVFGHDQYTEIKTIWIDTSDRSVDETVR